MVNSFNNYPNQQKILKLLHEIFITKPPLKGPYLPFEQSIVVPVYDKNMDFQGFHGRRIKPKPKSQYFKTGYLLITCSEILYGEHIPSILMAIQSRKQVILVKGIIDQFICYQEGYQQVYSTLNQGISISQFDKAISLPCTEIVVGFNSDKERKVISGLMLQNLKKIPLIFTDGSTDINDQFTSGLSLQAIIKKAKSVSFNQKEIKIQAAIKKRNAELKTLTEGGYTFLIERTRLETELKNSKGTHKKLNGFLKAESRKRKTLISTNRDYIRVPKTFCTGVVLSEFYSELRTLLYLMTRKYDNIPVRIKKETIIKSLNLSDRSVTSHLSKLEKLKYIIIDRKRDKNHKILYKIEPSLIKFNI